MSEQLVGFAQKKNAVIRKTCQVWLNPYAYEWGYDYRTPSNLDTWSAPNGVRFGFGGVSKIEMNSRDGISIRLGSRDVKNHTIDLCTLATLTPTQVGQIRQAFIDFANAVRVGLAAPTDFEYFPTTGSADATGPLVAINAGEKPHMVTQTSIFIAREVFKFIRPRWQSSTGFEIYINSSWTFGPTKLGIPKSAADTVTTLEDVEGGFCQSNLSFDVLSAALTELAAAYRKRQVSTDLTFV